MGSVAWFRSATGSGSGFRSGSGVESESFLRGRGRSQLSGRHSVLLLLCLLLTQTDELSDNLPNTLQYIYCVYTITGQGHKDTFLSHFHSLFTLYIFGRVSGQEQELGQAR